MHSIAKLTELCITSQHVVDKVVCVLRKGELRGARKAPARWISEIDNTTEAAESDYCLSSQLHSRSTTMTMFSEIYLHPLDP
jgi:hypothetical protein